MNCPECGQELSADDQACSKCGAEVATRALPSPPDPGYAGGPAFDLSRIPPGTRFASRFTIIEKVGEGGMAYVYKAIDRSLGHVVALKLIKPELACISTYVDRFKREVRVTRGINHPNVCRVYDYGESDDTLYMTMAWVEGETLRKLLNHAGSLTEARALEIAEKVSLALTEMHSHGNYHRDLKPENIMIDDRGEVFVMDFGIATEPGGERYTQTGLAPGTYKYMSPEQKDGKKVDARSDLYSLGLVLQEMLQGDSTNAAGHSSGSTNTDATRGVTPILKALLAEDRNHRYDSAQVVVDKLREIRVRSPVLRWWMKLRDWFARDKTRAVLVSATATAAVAALIIFVLIPAMIEPEPTPTPAEIYFQRGQHYLTEEVETESNLNDSINMFHRAIALDSTYAAAWAMLGEANYRLLERTDNPTFRATAEEAVARALELDPELPEAYTARSRGLIYEGFYDEAKQQAERAIELDPKFDMAWASLGRSHQMLGNYKEGLEALQRGARLNPQSFQHPMFLGNFFQHFREYDEAVAAYRRAADLKPDSPMAWNNIGSIGLQTGKPELAIEAFTKSIEMADRPQTQTNLGIAYYMMKDYENAIAHYSKATALEPNQATYWGNLGEALRIVKREDDAVSAFQKAVELARARVELTPLDPQSRRRLALWCARARDLKCAASEATTAYELMPDDAKILFVNAIVCCLQGNDTDALNWLEKAVHFGMGRAEIEMEPDLTALHMDPKYQKLLDLAG